MKARSILLAAAVLIRVARLRHAGGRDYENTHEDSPIENETFSISTVALGVRERNGLYLNGRVAWITAPGRDGAATSSTGRSSPPPWTSWLRSATSG